MLEDDLAAVIHALRWTAHYGDRDIAQACMVVMRESYQHLRRPAWQQLTQKEQVVLKRIMNPEEAKSA